jgi:predicted MFS family arabinose efflux permease
MAEHLTPGAGTGTPRRAGGWMPVIANATVAGVTQVFWLTYSPIATGSAEHYGVSSSAITWLANVYPVLYVILAIPIGRLLDRSPRSTLIAGALLTGLGGLVRIGADTYAAALAGQVIISIAQPVLLNGLIVVARANLPEEQRPAGIAAGSVGFFLGVLVGYTMPVLLVDGSDIHTLLVVQGVVGAVAALWMAWAVRNTQTHDLADDVGSGALRRVLRDRGVRVLALLAFGGFGLFGTLLAAIQPLLRHRGISTDSADLLVDGMVFAGLIVAAVLPPWAARRGEQRRVLLVALTVAAIATALAAVDVPLGVMAALMAIVGAMLVPALPILLELADQRVPELSGTISAVIWLAGNFGVAVLTGVASALYGDPTIAFLVLAVAGGATVLYASRTLSTAVAVD